MITNNNKRVLIAEDDYLVSELVCHIVKSLGFELAGDASTGSEAIEMVSALHPDVVLMDIQMPEMDGLEATRRIQKSCPTPVVILTAHETMDFVKLASRAGAGAFLIKPPIASEIERSIAIAMARHDDLMQLRKLNDEIKCKNQELEKALDEIQILRGILPICSYCKKIRDDKGYWNQLEQYICEHSDAEFTHGICPECAKEHYPQFDLRNE